MPEFVETLLKTGAVIAALVTIVGLFVVFWRISERLKAIGEAVLGKPEVTDFSGAVIEPAVPSIQARVTSLETLVRNNNQETRVAALEAWREDHERVTDAMVSRLMDHVLGESEGK